MIDLLAWRHYGRTAKRFEAILEDPRNYGLCDLPEILPINTPVVLPQFVEDDTLPVINVWGAQ